MLTQVLFNVFSLAFTPLSVRNAETRESSGDVRVKYRCYDWAFQRSRLRATGRTQQTVVRDLQYADDAAIVACDARELHEELTLMDV